MSNMNELKRFENELKGSEELRKKLDEAVKHIAAEGQAQSDGEVMVSAAKELGYDISITALEQAKADAEALDPEALAAVAGGFGDKVDGDGHDAWCLTLWHCFATTLHTTSDEDNEKATCWSDYRCMMFSNP